MANFYFNHVIIAGRLCADPELKTTQSGKSICSFSVAVNSTQKDADGNAKVDFFNLTAFGKTAENISKFFRKGNTIQVVGHLSQNRWTDPDGNKKSAVNVIADTFNFVDSRSEIQSTQADPGTYIPDQYKSSSTYDNSSTPSFTDITDVDDDLPF